MKQEGLILAVLTGFCLRLYASIYHPVDPDEWYNISMSMENNLESLFQKWWNSNSAHPIGIYLVNMLQYNIAGKSIEWMRFFNVIIGTYTIFLVSRIASDLCTDRAAEISTWMVALLSVFIITSSSIRGYSLLIFLSASCMFFVTKEIKRAGGRNNLFLLFFSMLCCSYIHYFGAMFTALVLVFLLVEIKARNGLSRKYLIFTTCIALANLPLIFSILHFIEIGAGSTNNYIDSYMEIGMIYNIISSYLNGSTLITVPAIIFVTFSLVRRFFRDGNELFSTVDNRILLFWLSCPIIFAGLVSLSFTPIITPSNLSLSAPAMCIFLGKTIDKELLYFQKNLPSLPYPKIIAFALMAHLILLYNFSESSRPDLERPFSEVSEIVGGSDVIIVVNSDRFVVASPNGDECWNCHYLEGNVSEIIILGEDSKTEMALGKISNSTKSNQAEFILIMELTGWMPPFEDSLISGLEGDFMSISDTLVQTPGSGVRTIVLEIK